MRRLVVVLTLAGVAGGVAVWLLEPNLLVGLRSPRALAWTAAVAAGCLAAGLLVRRLGAPPLVAAAAGLLPALVAGGLVVVRPILMPRSLTEAFPTPAPAESPASPTVSPASPASPASSPASPAGQAGTVRLGTGTLRGLAGHEAAGRVSTYRLADGSHVVRFEQVDIGGTPDPEVYVLAGHDRTGKRGGVHLGALKAEKGSFHYALPPSFAGQVFTVVVWCERFAVDIAHATQA